MLIVTTKFKKGCMAWSNDKTQFYYRKYSFLNKITIKDLHGLDLMIIIIEECQR